MDWKSAAAELGYENDGQHVVLPFRLSPPSRTAAHPVAGGGELTVSPRTGYVAGMVLDHHHGSAFGTMYALALRRAFQGASA